MNFDQCLFELLASFGQAELQLVCDFVDNKIVLLQNEINKALSIIGSIDQYLGEANEVVDSVQGIIDNSITASTLMSRVLSLSPACVDIQTVFGGLIDAGSAAYSSLSVAQYIVKQVQSAQNVLIILRREVDELIQSLQAICTIVKLMIEQQTQTAEKNFFGARS